MLCIDTMYIEKWMMVIYSHFLLENLNIEVNFRIFVFDFANNIIKHLWIGLSLNATLHSLRSILPPFGEYNLVFNDNKVHSCVLYNVFTTTLTIIDMTSWFIGLILKWHIYFKNHNSINDTIIAKNTIHISLGTSFYLLQLFTPLVMNFTVFNVLFPTVKTRFGFFVWMSWWRYGKFAPYCLQIQKYIFEQARVCFTCKVQVISSQG